MSNPSTEVVRQPTQIIVPEPSATKELEREADVAIRYLENFTGSSGLDPELRMAMNDIQNTLKALKRTVKQQAADAKQNHERMAEIIRSQRHH